MKTGGIKVEKNIICIYVYMHMHFYDGVFIRVF